MKKLIDGYNNYYIYDTGEVYNIETGKILKGSVSENGYKYYRLSYQNKKKMFYGHRLVAEAFIPNPDNLPVVNHIDGNKLNNDISNLEWVTYSENNKKSYDNNTSTHRRTRKKYIEDLEGENWVKIKGYPNYSVSSCGRVRNDATGYLLQPNLPCGYYNVTLCANGVYKSYSIHNLVYFNFNEDTSTKGCCIDHIDGNKLNNKLSNLRKISFSENVQAALYTQKTNKTTKAVGQYTKEGELLDIFPSCAEAGRQLKLDPSTISKVCRGNTLYKTCGGYIFKYI